MKKLIIPLIALAILYSCEKSSEVDVIAEEGLIGVSLRLDKGFAVSNTDSSVDSSWPHIFQDLVDITFSSTTSSYSKTVSFNPNDVSSFPNTSLPYDTYNWSIANTGGSVTVSSALYIYGSSSSAFTVSSASTTIPLTLSTDFALVTVSETNLSSVSISQGGTDTSLTTNNGFYYGYINSAFSDYTVTFTSVEDQSASDTITTPSASTHYNYTISYEGGTSVTVALSDTFQLEERDVTIGSSVNLSSGLVAWYPFNENANDESGNGNDGTVNGASLTADRFGNTDKAYLFTVSGSGGWGSAQNRITVANPSIPNTNSFSISAWVEIDSKPSPFDNRPHTIMGRWDGNGTAVIRHQIDYSGQIGTNLLSGATDNTLSGGSLQYGNWEHVLISYDGSVLRQYQNGNLVNSTTLNIQINTSTTDLTFGELHMSNGHWYLFSGKMDDLGYWSRPLNISEIQALYNETDSDLTN